MSVAVETSPGREPVRLRVRLLAGPFTTRGRLEDGSRSVVLIDGDVPPNETLRVRTTLPTSEQLPADAIDLWLLIECGSTWYDRASRRLWLSAVG